MAGENIQLAQNAETAAPADPALAAPALDGTIPVDTAVDPSALPVDGSVWNVEFDDWMFLMDDSVMINKAVMSKFGIRVGEVTLSFKRRTPLQMKAPS